MQSFSTDKRRNFLKSLGVAGLGSFLSPSFTNHTVKPHLSITDLLQKDVEPDEPFWEMVKKQFQPSKGIMNVNSANLCPAPHFVVDEVIKHYRDLVGNVSFQHRAHFNEKRTRAINRLSSFLNAQKSSLGITRNTSEANNIVVNGLDLGPGDEVLIWNQNHPSNRESWQKRAERSGFSVRSFEVTSNPESTDALLKEVVQSISASTRVLAFSHISNVSGLSMPAKAICEAANQLGVMTLVDGAQALGCVRLDLTAMGCTFYTSSTHKWLMGPMENGVLYVHPDYKARIWPNIIAAGWKDDINEVDQRLCALGQRNTPSTAGLESIIDFHEVIGAELIEKRIKQLNTYLKTALQESVEGITFVTPMDESLSAGVTIFNLRDKDHVQVFQALYTDYGIAAAPTGGIRLSPTINSTLKDMDRIVEVVQTLSGS